MQRRIKRKAPTTKPKRAAPSLPWRSEATNKNVLTVRLDIADIDGWEQWFLLRTDAHHDNPDCNQDLERLHLQQAVDRNAGIIDAGDLFCAMQGKYDKRSSKNNVRPEHQTDSYLEALVDTAAEFYQPFAKNWLVMGVGNHETAIHDRHNSHLTERLVALLRARGSSVVKGGYTGWVRILCTFFGTERHSLNLWYAHGWGGGGPVTINTIQAANRMPMMIEGADVLFTGHVHECWTAEKVRVTLSQNGNVVHKPITIVQGASYKDEYRSGEGGWHVQTGKPPKPVGAWWLRLFYRNRVLHHEVIRADRG